MGNREQHDNWINRIRLELLNAGFDIQKLRVDLQPKFVIIVKPVQFLEGEVWNRLMELLRGLGFRWFREDGAWKKGMIES